MLDYFGFASLYSCLQSLLEKRFHPLSFYTKNKIVCKTILFSSYKANSKDALG